MNKIYKNRNIQKYSDKNVDFAPRENEPQLDNEQKSSLSIAIEDLILSNYDYHLPKERIAQNPASPRDSARLLVLDAAHTDISSAVLHRVFRNLPDLLRPGDLLVMNNTRVIPARLYGYKSTGAPVEVLLLEEKEDNCWLALVKPGRRLKPGAKIIFTPHQHQTENSLPSFPIPHSPFPSVTATVIATDEATGGRILRFDFPVNLSFSEILAQFGQIPLPPYITDSEAENEQYQTVYAQRQGAIAAPTAGLHFTPELLLQLHQKGIEQSFVTLHVGIGTFRPVEVEDVTTHKMHGEWVEVPLSTVEKIRETKSRGGRIIAVGTTVVRSLEAAALSGKLQPYYGKTELFIYPGYEWRVVEGMITNFHLPRSSLLMLVSALIGRQRLLTLYSLAIAEKYRFYSFGDAMLILPKFKIRN